MEQLSTLDAGFLQAEDSDRHVSLAIGALSVLAGPMPDFDALVAGLADRILSVPRFRQVLRTQPFDFGAPQWVDDPNLDISRHVRRAALPRPGDDAALFRWVAEVMERRLDRDRPLWECWIVDGLANNRWAILMKVHHCIADGIAATHMLAGSTTTVEAARSRPRSAQRRSRPAVVCGCRQSHSIRSTGFPRCGALNLASQQPRRRRFRARPRSRADCYAPRRRRR
jgi:diacylglycerol O-acyltransferase